MSTTTNMGIELINGSDYISPDPINDGFTKLDKLGVDYITERGTSGNWWYRKWNSGRAECGIEDYNFGALAFDEKWGSLYLTHMLTFGAYPISFAKNPSTVINFLYDDGGTYGAFLMMRATKSEEALIQSPKFSLARADAITISGAHVGIFVNGTLKSE